MTNISQFPFSNVETGHILGGIAPGYGYKSQGLWLNFLVVGRKMPTTLNSIII